MEINPERSIQALKDRLSERVGSLRHDFAQRLEDAREKATNLQSKILENAQEKATNLGSKIRDFFLGTTLSFADAFDKELEAIAARRASRRAQEPHSDQSTESGLPDFHIVFRKELESMSPRSGPDAGEENMQSPTAEKSNDRARLNILKSEYKKLKEEDQKWREATDRDAAFKHDGLVAVALSGGGIRSATFNLGVLQVLATRGILDRVDYLSTVSGGGYAGCCLRSLAASGQATFPFQHRLGQIENQRFKHLREYSNYLAPHGLLDKLRMPILFVRGLVLNFLLLIPVVLIVAAAYVLTVHNAKWIEDGFRAYFFSISLVLILVVAFVVYPLVRRLLGLAAFSKDGWELRNWATRRLGAYAGMVAIFVLVETQARALDIYQELTNVSGKSWYALLAYLPDIAGAAIAVATIVFAFVAGKSALAGGEARRTVSLFLLGVLGPLLFWFLFLVLAKWAIHPDEGRIEQMLLGWIPDNLSWTSAFPDWIKGPMTWALRSEDGGVDEANARALLFVLAAAILYVLGAFVNVNEYALHGFYRDRLSKAYLMKSGADEERPKHNDGQPLRDAGTNCRWMPYHVINTALNVTRPGENGKEESITRPGRTAESFFFTRDYSGSDATGFCLTERLEAADQGLNLGTAMAISGAAFAPNMGNVTMRPLVFILTMLNVRLCYWLVNPKVVSSGFTRTWNKISPPGRWLLFKELVAALGTDDDYINLSDGGHMDNLGIYELLRRRCRLIIACDAESDPEYDFEGLTTVTRLAKIDMGIDVEFEEKELERIRKREQPYAIGVINYATLPNDEIVKGKIIYIKASCGPWNNAIYVERYRRHHEKFPHETTLDQFYGEEQFECYRALGYATANYVL